MEIDEETKDMPVDNLRYAHSVQKKRILVLAQRIEDLEKENQILHDRITLYEARLKQWERFKEAQQNIIQNAITASNLQDNQQKEQIDRMYKENRELKKKQREE